MGVFRSSLCEFYEIRAVATGYIHSWSGDRTVLQEKGRKKRVGFRPEMRFVEFVA